MRRSVIALAALVLALPATARADGGAAAAEVEAEDAGDGDAAPAASQEIGARTGMALGGRVAPGGFHLGGSYLYQMSGSDWFDTGIDFSIGSGAADCFRDRDDSVVCDHGALDGIGFQLTAGVRRFFPGQGRFTPYAHAGLGLRVVSYSGDDVTGIAVPVWLGGGVRALVHDGIHVVGGAVLSAGPGWFNRGLGLEPQLSMTVAGGVDFALD